MGDDLYPARARPVPFCRQGFAPDRSTSAFVFVLAEPERRAARMATTVSWTACEPLPSSISSMPASLAAALVRTFALIGFLSRASSPLPPDHVCDAPHVPPRVFPDA